MARFPTRSSAPAPAPAPAPAGDAAVMRDPLTKLPMGETLLALAARLAATTREARTRSVLALVEVDHVATMERRFGPSTVDFVVGRLAAALRAVVAPGDVLGRVMSTRFLVVLSDRTPKDTRALLRILMTDLASAVPKSLAPISLSAGVAELGPRERLAPGMLRAVRALVAAKRDGYGRIELAPARGRRRSRPPSVRPAAVPF